MATTINGSAGVTTNSGAVYDGLQRATAQASTSGTSIDFTGIPSWAKRITVILNGISHNGTDDFLIQLGDSGGIETTGYLGSSADGPTLNSSLYTTGFGLRCGTAAATLHGLVVIANLSTNTWIASGTIGRSDGAAFIATGGSKTLSATLDRVRITSVNGTVSFDAGNINIIYE